MKKNKKKIIKSLLGAAGSATLIGPAVTMLNSNTEINVNDDVVVKDKETSSKQFEWQDGLFAEDVPVLFGGSVDFSATLGFVHADRAGRGWSNMFWGNHWNFAVNNGAEQMYRDHGIGKQKSISAERMTGKKFTYSDHRENLGDGSGYNTDAVFLNEGSLGSTLAYDNYEIQVERKDEGSGDSNPVYTSQLRSNFELGKDPDLMDDVSSSFLLVMYSMFITGEGAELTGDPTMDVSPEFLHITPVVQINRGGFANMYNGMSLAGAVGGGIIGALSTLGGGSTAAVTIGLQGLLASLFGPQMNMSAHNGIMTTLSNPSYIALPKAKEFIWNEGVRLRNKYFTDENYHTKQFFVNDISLTMDLETKLEYDGIHGWKPFMVAKNPGVSISYTASGTRTVVTASTYDYSHWIIEKR